MSSASATEDVVTDESQSSDESANSSDNDFIATDHDSSSLSDDSESDLSRSESESDSDSETDTNTGSKNFKGIDEVGLAILQTPALPGGTQGQNTYARTVNNLCQIIEAAYANKPTKGKSSAKRATGAPKKK